MSTMNRAKDAIINELQPLFEKAEAGGLWFFIPYQQMWFSPRELQQAQANGRFLWGVVNWQLRNPKEREAELERDIEAANRALENFRERM